MESCSALPMDNVALLLYNSPYRGRSLALLLTCSGMEKRCSRPQNLAIYKQLDRKDKKLARKSQSLHQSEPQDTARGLKKISIA